jgi:hypothetical protein
MKLNSQGKFGYKTIVKAGQVYIFYAAGDNRFAENPHRASTALRIVPIERYTSWSNIFKVDIREQVSFEISN